MNSNTTQLSPLVVDEEYERGVVEYNNRHQLQAVPEHIQFVFTIAVEILLTGIFCVFGAMANIVNIVVFYRQGPMSSSPTVILTGLAVSDLLVCAIGIMVVFFKIIEWFVGKVVFGWWVQNLLVLSILRPQQAMVQVTCWNMTLLTLERALSVIFPFKIKAIFTPRRSLAVLVAIFVLTFVLHIPGMTQFKPAWVKHLGFHPERFMIVVDSHIFSTIIKEITFTLNDVVFRFLGVFLVVLCNVFIFWKVRSSQRFRKSNANIITEAASPHTTQEDPPQVDKKMADTTSKGNHHQPSSKEIKDRKLLRMITVVAGVFLFCYSLSVINTIVMTLVFEVRADYHVSLSNMLSSSIEALEYFNSCINAVIYFNMSARYREELLGLCGKRRR